MSDDNDTLIWRVFGTVPKQSYIDENFKIIGAIYHDDVEQLTGYVQDGTIKDINYHIIFWPYNPLTLAIKFRAEKCIKKLLESGADMDLLMRYPSSSPRCYAKEENLMIMT